MHEALANALLAHEDAIADRAVVLDEARDPERFARWGEAGRARCLEDAGYHVRYLAASLRFGSDALFDDYVEWLVTVLAGLAIDRAHVKSHFESLESAVLEIVTDSEAATSLLERARDHVDRVDTELPPCIVPGSRHEELARKYLADLLALRRREAAAAIVDAADAGIPIRELYVDVLLPAQREIGRLWQQNRITVAQEHYCTAASQVTMSLLYPRMIGGAPHGRRLVATSVAGDLHEIGVRMIADLFELDGWSTIYLGASSPIASLVSTITTENADLVAISATMPYHVAAVRASIQAIRAERPDLPILVGGRPFAIDPSLVASVGADGSASGPDDAIAKAEELTR